MGLMKNLRGLLRLAGAALLPAVIGCSDTTPPVPASVPPELDALYSMIRESRRDYEKGIGLIVAGDELLGKNVLESSTDRLALAASLCSRTAGCNSELFNEALRQVYDLQKLALRDPATAAPEPDFAQPLAGGTVESIEAPATTQQRQLSVPRLSATNLRERIPDNPQVKSALNDWLTWNRPTLIQTYRYYQFLQPRMAPVYADADLPEALLFGILATETGAKVHSYSPAGAVGPLQFMRHTARRYGLGSINGFDMRLDPEAATRANARYLRDQLDAFDNNIEKTLAAYNGGETRLRRLHRADRSAGFWDAPIYRTLPTETRQYVPRVLAAALLFLEPETYDLRLSEPDAEVSTIVLAEEVGLGELTICLGPDRNPEGWFRTLRNLNPQLDATERTSAGQQIAMPSVLVPQYAERCTGESELLTLARDLHDAAYPDEPEIVQYTVRSGDTLARIARRRPCWSVSKLAALNKIKAPRYVIHPGQRLDVPSCS